MNSIQLLSKPSFKSLLFEWHELSWWWDEYSIIDYRQRTYTLFGDFWKTLQKQRKQFSTCLWWKKVLFGESRSPFEEHAEIFTDMQFGGRFSELAEKSSFHENHENCFLLFWEWWHFFQPHRYPLAPTSKKEKKLLKALICGYVWTINTLLNCLHKAMLTLCTPQVNKVHVFTALKM